MTGWYDRIEEPIRSFVRALRGRGVNTTCSCGHTMEVEAHWLPDGELKEVYDFIYAWLSERGEEIDFTLTARVQVLGGCPVWSLSIHLGRAG